MTTPSSDEKRPQAVAIQYDDRSAAPRVVAKGYGTLAETIIQTAKDNGLYVHESTELVGVLMKLDLDQQIPPGLYVAIAELLAWLYELEGKSMEDVVQQAKPGTPGSPPRHRNG